MKLKAAPSPGNLAAGRRVDHMNFPLTGSELGCLWMIGVRKQRVVLS